MQGPIIGFVILTVGLCAVAGFIGMLIWAYRWLTTRNTQGVSAAATKANSENHTARPLVSTEALQFPPHFGWALASSLLGFHIGLYAYVTYFGPITRLPAAGILVFSVFAAITWLTLLHKSKSLFVYSTIFASVVAAAFLYFRANGFVQTWNVFFLVLSQILLFVYFTTKHLPISVGGWLKSVLMTIPISLVQGIRVVGSVFKKDLTSRSTFFAWVKTAVIAFVVLLIFLSLLSQADPVFAEVMREFRSQLIGRWLWSILLIFFFAAWWTTSQSKSEEKESQASWLSYRDIGAILGVVTIVVGIFLTVQFQYLFGASRDLLETLDLTFSEYVRKGFTELLLAVFIGGILAYLTGAKLRSQDHTNSKVIGIFNTVMVVELGLLLLSAFRRDMLYVETYGLTRVRVIGEVFLIWLAFFLVVLLAYGWKKLREKMALTLLWVGALLVLLSINVMNVDRMIVRGAPGHHEYTDYFYLMQLSEDAGQDWPELLQKINTDLQPLLAKESLTPEERAQMAGLKLGLVSFIENRDLLYTKYAPEDWLLQNHKKLGFELSTTGINTYESMEWGYPRQIADTAINDTTDKTSDIQQTNKVIPESLQDYRVWQFSNWAEKQTYELLKSQEETIYTVPDQLLEQIVRYQVRTQTNLAEQEKRLLYDLKYQFITVELKRYNPQHFSYYNPQSLSGTRSYVTQEFKALEAGNSISVAQLAGLQCSSPQVVQPQTFRIYAQSQKEAQITDVNNPFLNEMKRFSLRPLGAGAVGSPVIEVTMPVGVSITSFLENPDDAVGDEMYYSGDGLRTIQERPMPSYVDSAAEAEPAFVYAVLTPVAMETGSGCKVSFTTSEMRALYQLN